MAEPLPLDSVHERLGARFGVVAGRRVPRSYGEAATEYRAAHTAAAVVDRSGRALVRVFGRDPVKMIDGLLTNDVATAPEGQGVYGALLTPKGKMVADVRVFRQPDGELMLDADGQARENVLDHLRRFVPPLFARFEDVSGSHGVLGVFGPSARDVVEQALDRTLPGTLPEDGFVLQPLDGARVLVARTLYAGVDGYDMIAPVAGLARLWDRLVAAGARPIGHAALEVLRIEAGRPRWGAELDENVIPLEAGLRERAISETKGCYTGQEVIVRILHRGHVNWQLRGFLLGEVPAPAQGVGLVAPEGGKKLARLTSTCHSPRHDQTIGLGYARREIEPPVTLRLERVDGPDAVVVDLPFPSTDMGEPFRAANE